MTARGHVLTPHTSARESHDPESAELARHSACLSVTHRADGERCPRKEFHDGAGRCVFDGGRSPRERRAQTPLAPVRRTRRGRSSRSTSDESDGGVIQYLADRNPDAKLVPPNGTIERYRLQEWLNFITSELHKSFGALFNPEVPADYKQFAKDLIASRFAYVDRHLAQHGPFLMGSQFTVADAYLFTVANWTHFLKIDLGQWPNLKAYVERVAARPKVQEALKAERLVR